jgi:hypothetical protein
MLSRPKDGQGIDTQCQDIQLLPEDLEDRPNITLGILKVSIHTKRALVLLLTNHLPTRLLNDSRTLLDILDAPVEFNSMAKTAFAAVLVVGRAFGFGFDFGIGLDDAARQTHARGRQVEHGDLVDCVAVGRGLPVPGEDGVVECLGCTHDKTVNERPFLVGWDVGVTRSLASLDVGCGDLDPL